MDIQTKKILFIVNPVSGTGRQKRFEKRIDKFLDKSRYTYKIAFSDYPGHAIELSRQAMQENTDIVVAVGGDGTVNEVGRSLVGTESALAIIPTGSGNGLARHLGIPMSFRRSLEIVNRGKIRNIDTGSLNGRVFLNIAGVGFDAHIARKFDQTQRRGFFTYFHIATSSYKKYKPKKYKLIVDGTPVKRKAFMISFANSSQFGNNASIDGRAKIDDGLLDVCIVKKLPFWKVIILSPLLFVKKFERTPYVEIIQAKEISVEREKGRYIHLDGDPVQQGKSFTVLIHPLSLHIIVP
ncbi:MAG: diacylglycerol kinase family protein [bacterium]